MKKYIINRLCDFMDFIMSCIPDGERYTSEDKDIMKRIRKLRHDNK